MCITSTLEGGKISIACPVMGIEDSTLHTLILILGVTRLANLVGVIMESVYACCAVIRTGLATETVGKKTMFVSSTVRYFTSDWLLLTSAIKQILVLHQHEPEINLLH